MPKQPVPATQDDLLGRMRPSVAWLVAWSGMAAAWLLLFGIEGRRFAVPWSVACQLVASALCAVSGWLAVRDVRRGRQAGVMYLTDWATLSVLFGGLFALPLAFQNAPDRLLATAFLAAPVFSETIRALGRLRRVRTRTTLDGLTEVFE